LPISGTFCRRAAVLAIPALLLSGCIPIILGGAAAGGGYAAGQERGVVTTAKDTGIKATIKDKFFRYSTDMSDQIDTTVWEGEVLLTGSVSNPQWRDEASRLAWQAEGVKAQTSLWDNTKDSWITTRLRSAITLDSKIRSLNYSVETVNGVVYLMGAARTQGEADLVTDYARNIPNVRRVVSFVHLRPGEPSRDIAPTSGAPAPAPSSGAPAYNAPPANAPAYTPPGQSGAPAPLAPPPSRQPKVEMTPLS
jgi:osmotically-inducible protein OsmY